jgi:opacity protein-like surface antigen
MKKSLVAAALAAALAGPASAATVIDFTKDNAESGFVAGIKWEVTAENGTLVNARHKNGKGCAPYACTFTAQEGDDYDVGFGVSGANREEIDFGLEKAEAVVVTFKEAVRVFGFAGLLAYVANGGTNGEDVQLEYSNDGVNWGVAGVAKGVAPVGKDFDTVGLASLSFVKAITAKAFRFKAVGSADDKTINVTAGALIVAPVPVPASLPLLLAGLGALGWAARRKRKSA